MALISILTVENTNSSFYVGGNRPKAGWNGCGVENEMQIIFYLNAWWWGAIQGRGVVFHFTVKNKCVFSFLLHAGAHTPLRYIHADLYSLEARSCAADMFIREIGLHVFNRLLVVAPYITNSMLQFSPQHLFSPPSLLFLCCMVSLL